MAAVSEQVCDGRRLLAALDAAATWLDAHRAAVDALNVFPVPDGDTGGNMSQTLSAAAREAHASPAHEAGVIAERAAYGALMGARGNSGVILSQLLRGFARALQGRRALGPHELAAALSAAAETAGRAVMKPVEGTILTVANDAARVAVETADAGADLLPVLDAALAEARAAVARTPDQLPILKQAGVVDAGAQGYVLVLEGASRYLHGRPVRPEGAGRSDGSAASAPTTPAATQPTRVAHVAHGDDYGYCTEFVVVGPRLDPLRMRADIAALGNSLIVVGEEGIVRVHVHTEDPGRVLSYAGARGQLHRIKIDNMQAQHDRFVGHTETDAEPAREADVTAESESPTSAGSAPTASAMSGQVGVVVVAPGAGLGDVFRSLGADVVVPGGQTMNPSTAELLAAIDGLPQDEVLLLPNNSNVLLTAGQARDLSRKTVRLVPARTVPQGIAALIAYSAGADLEPNATAMEEAAAAVRTGEVTVAVRDAQLDGLAVHSGEALGLLDDEAVTVGPTCDGVALDLMARMGAGAGALLTVYYGREVKAEAAQDLAARARLCYEGLEVEVVDGGQPHYPYILSLEAEL